MKIEEEIKQKSFRNEYQKAAINVLFTGNWLENKYKHFFKEKKFQITLQQYNVLKILKGQYPDSASINLIKKNMLDKMSDVSRIVERLRKSGLVRRELCPDDRRSVDVTITQVGLDLINEVDRQNDELDAVLNNLSEEEVKILNQLLDKVREDDIQDQED
ncbi:MAG: MarR family transcriptional regulator [Microscillaceae bacterium]|nr:MarR family transcriptional regulator [Microscillaceae bacterium]